MLRRALASLATLATALTVAACGGGALPPPPSWPSRATPMQSTLGWFDAINAHDRRRLLSYVDPSAYSMMGWARPSDGWGTFTHLKCKPLGRTPQAELECTFNESASSVEGNPDSFWDVYLQHTGRGWLIDNYGQG